MRGGLGNQLFQVCFGLALARRYNHPISIVDDFYTPENQKSVTPRSTYFDTVFSGMVNQRWTRELSGRAILALPQSTDAEPFSFNLDRAPDIVANGYFQKWSLIEPAVSPLLENLNVPNLQAPYLNMYNYSECIALHFRYGDYVSKYSHVYHALRPVYYKKATMQLLKSSHGIKRVLLFCQQGDWNEFVMPIKSELERVFPNITFERPNTKSDVDDLLVMSLCPAIAISNSSFSYWAALFPAQCGKKSVVCPKLWFKHAFGGASSSEICALHWKQL